jgi:hypothetical protein
MATARIEHPVLNISVNGNTTVKRPSYFRLITDQGLHSVEARLRYPADAEVGKNGDKVSVNLSLNGEKHLLFTGEIFCAGIHGGYLDLALTDSYKKLCDTVIVAGYRKETASVILQDTLDKAGVEKTSITCPGVEIARFSTEKIPADECVIQLIKTLEEYGHKGFRFFFNAEDIFCFGTVEDTGKNEGTVYEFNTAKNILKKGDGWIQVLPLPIRHSQEIKLDGKSLFAWRTDLTVSGTSSRLRIWLKEAA